MPDRSQRCGEESLLRLVAGIYPPTSGSVDVKGRTFALLGGSISLSPMRLAMRTSS